MRYQWQSKYVVLAGKRASLKMCLSVLNSSEACQLLIAIQSKSDMKVNFFKMKIFTPTIQKVLRAIELSN